MVKPKVYKYFEPLEDDGEKFYLPSRVDPTGYEPLDDIIRRAVDPEFIPDLLRRAQQGYTTSDEEADNKGNSVFNDIELNELSDFDISDKTENDYAVSKIQDAIVASRKKSVVKKEPAENQAAKGREESVANDADLEDA